MTKRYSLLDFYRFIAAIMVVVYHYTFNGIVNGKIQSLSYSDSEITKYGYLGVELFFIISGFVIYNSVSNSTPSKFITSRLTRLFPAYWFCLLLTTLIIVFFGSDYNFSVTATQVVINLTMIQQLIGISHVDGVYWTLTYELLFYFLVFFIFFIGSQSILQKFLLFWPSITFILYLMGMDTLPYMGGYFYFFCSGVVLSMICKSASKYLYVSLAFLLFLSVKYSLENSDLYSVQKGVEYSSAVITIVICSFFIMLFILKYDFFKFVKIPMSATLGKITYPLYLIHAHIGYIYLNMFANDGNKYYVVLFLICLMLFASYLIHKIIEERLHMFWKSIFTHIIFTPINMLHSKYLKLKINWIKNV